MSASPPIEHEPVTIIEPPAAWRLFDVAELWAYRELFWVLAARDVKVRYRQAVLGAAWAIVRPAAMMLLFTAVFGILARVPSDGLPYAIFVYTALLPWTFFATAVAAAAQSLVGSAHLISKVYFPRLIIPFAATGAAIVDLFVSALLLLALMAWYGIGWTPQLLLAPLAFVVLLLVTLGTGVLLAALTVAYRDFTHITPFLLQAWLYLTPVVFPASLVPPHWSWVLRANPMTGVVEAFRSAFLGRPLDTGSLAYSALAGILLLTVGIAYFHRAERRFADII